MTEAISSGEWVDILVSGVSDSMKQLAVYYSCSLSIFFYVNLAVTLEL